MTLHRNHREITFECDRCGAFLDGGTDFDDALDELRSQGWRAVRDGDDWEHHCPGCR